MRIHWALLLLFALFPLGGMAHSESTGDPAHDQNADHLAENEDMDPLTTPQTVGSKEITSWENAAPFIGIFFLALFLFAFAMGAVLHPEKGKRTR